MKEDADYFLAVVEANGKLELNEVTLSNVKRNGLNVKVLGGSAVLNNVIVNSTTGGAIEVTEADLGTHSKAGTGVINNCVFNQSTYGDWCSTCVSVSGGSYVLVNSGLFTSENYGIYVFSSGGVVEVNNGKFTTTGTYPCFKAAMDSSTYSEYTGGILVHNGIYTGTAEITSPAYMIIDGGTFSFNPTEFVDTDNYTVTETDGKFTVTKK